jgi:hypothetical protein
LRDRMSRRRRCKRLRPERARAGGPAARFLRGGVADRTVAWRSRARERARVGATSTERRCTMLSESARMSSAAEAAFRIQAPNSRPRVVKIVALDAESEGVVRKLAAGSWNQASFSTAALFTKNLDEEVAGADLVVMVAGPGGRADSARLIGRACSDRRIMTTALIVGSAAASDEALSKTLSQVRPWSLMVVIADADSYIEDMLMALRA